MNENRIEGAAKVVGGRFQKATGEILEDREMYIRGGVREGVGHVQEAAGSAQEILEDAVDHVKSAASTAGKVYDGVSGFTREVARTIEERSYLSVAAAAAIGLLVGLLIAGRGPKVIYVKPKV
jgi:uncharacterized protein YjbJ (UPF0337 family)